MLEEIKQIYQETADSLLPNWKEIDKNDLIKTAAELKNSPLRDGYISAIMLTYWNKIVKYHFKCSMVASPEDVHSWLVIALTYALDNKPWENPESSIYQDKNGPDKVVNTAMESRRLTFYQQLNRYNRRINSNLLSLDNLTDEFKDLFIPMSYDDYEFEVAEIILNYFNKKDYFMAFMIDAIVHEDVLTPNLNRKRLASHFRHMDDKFISRFSNMYRISYDKVREATTYVTGLSAYKFNNKVEYGLILLKNQLKG